MTQNRRIVLNVMATHGRTLFSIVCGLFTVRWVLMVLGHENFGVYGVVGSMAIVVVFLNIQFSEALARFYAVAIGSVKASGNASDAIEDCRAWFSCGVAIHLVVPFLLVLIGYPIGISALKHGWLTVPSDKLDTCIWLWRFSCLSSFVSMMNSPFQAMYIAKQYIVELTIYTFAQTIVRTTFVYAMTIIPGDWLFGYGLGMCLISMAPQLLICWRAFRVFDECRLRRSALSDLSRIRRIASFAWWKMFEGIGYMARHQCLEIIVNRHFGPKANAAYTVAATFGTEAASLTGALNGAFSPVIASLYGEGRLEFMRKMAMRSCKFGTLLTLMFAIPMFLEANEVLRLWLKNPPDNAVSMCEVMLGVVVIEKLTAGHYMAVLAMGDIRGLMIWRGLSCLVVIPAVLLAIWFVPTVVSVPVALLVTTVIVAFSDVYYARVKACMGICPWIKEVIIPLMTLTLVCAGTGSLVVAILQESFLRVCVTTFACLMVFVPMVWVVCLDAEERQFVVNKVRRLR